MLTQEDNLNALVDKLEGRLDSISLFLKETEGLLLKCPFNESVEIDGEYMVGIGEIHPENQPKRRRLYFRSICHDGDKKPIIEGSAEDRILSLRGIIELRKLIAIKIQNSLENL